MSRWDTIKQGLFVNFLYDRLKEIIPVVISIVIPLVYHYLDFPSLKAKLSTLNLSIFLAIVITIFIIGKRISNWGKNTFKIGKNTKIFYFRPNIHVVDKTENTKFLLEQCKVAKDICILGATGYRTFARKDSESIAPLREVLEDITGEIKILLFHPKGQFTISRANALGVPLDDYQREIMNSINFLKELKNKGENIALKLYMQRPIWKMIILDNFMWLQYYHPKKHVERMPVYGISRSQKKEEYSLFDPLYGVFQKKWYHDGNPTYDFNTGEAVSPDGRRESL